MSCWINCADRTKIRSKNSLSVRFEVEKVNGSQIMVLATYDPARAREDRVVLVLERQRCRCLVHVSLVLRIHCYICVQRDKIGLCYREFGTLDTLRTRRNRDFRVPSDRWTMKEDGI